MRLRFLRSWGAKGFMSGSWASRSGLFTPDEFSKLTEEMLIVRDQLNPRNTDQAFINYCCDARRLRTARLSELIGDLCASGWARHRGHLYRDRNGIWRLWDYGGLDHGKRMMAVHWAGLPLSFLGPQGALLFAFARTSLRYRFWTLVKSVCCKVMFAVRANRVANHSYKRINGFRQRFKSGCRKDSTRAIESS
jgi:hypothetical protein